MSVWTVFGAAMLTAIFTGLGALPFLFVKDISKSLLGMTNAAAAGLMLGASIGLLIEGYSYGIGRLGFGLILGLLLVVIAHRLLENQETDVTSLQGANLRKMILIIGIMTVHSFAEGIGVGVSFGGGETLGTLITTAIAVHNIPEGLAISLVLIPRGASVWKAGGWSIFSSLPQPLMAVPAFLFVLYFAPFLPIGLGLAAGAMIWMVFKELLPEAVDEISRPKAWSTMSLAVIAMITFQFLIS